MAGQTPSQTVGPFFDFGLVPERYGRGGIASGQLAGDDADGQHIVVTGRVFDGEGKPVPDAIIEVWQADASGRYAHAGDGRNADFRGFGRVGTAADGSFRFVTIKPGPVPAPGGGQQAPHLGVILFCRGLLSHAFTRIYFAGEPSNADDPVLGLVGPARCRTLIARASEDRPGHYHWDVHLQGDDETVFFDA